MTMPLDYCAGRLPDSLKATRQGQVGVLRLMRSGKRGEPDDQMILGLEKYFSTLADSIRAVVLASESDNFCLWQDVSEHKERSVIDSFERSRLLDSALDHIQFGKVPVVAVLRGAVTAGGLELAASAHVRVAERSTLYALPGDSQRVLFTGAVSRRLARLIGPTRIVDMMLTGRAYSAAEGQEIGLSTYLVDDGEGLAKGLELAERIAANSPMTNIAITQMLPLIAQTDPANGFALEALMEAVAHFDSGQSDHPAEEG